MLLELLEGTVSGRANKPALVSPERTWTYAELGNVIEERAKELVGTEVEPGRVHVIDAHPDSTAVIEILG